MAAVVLTDIPSYKDVEQVKKELHIDKHVNISQRFDKMIEQADKIAKPKAVFREAFSDIIGENMVNIGGVTFNSRIMYSNLKDVGRVFAYAATCGRELDEWASQFISDQTDQYLADGIKQLYLIDAAKYLIEYISKTYGIEKSATMNPGSLPDWPISEQAKLLPIIGDVEKLIGVTLTNSFLLVPLKSVSGILFPTQIDYVNCKLCTKKDCVGRRAPFDAKMYKEKLG